MRAWVAERYIPTSRSLEARELFGCRLVIHPIVSKDIKFIWEAFRVKPRLDQEGLEFQGLADVSLGNDCRANASFSNEGYARRRTLVPLWQIGSAPN
jgi:hypothetical protein